jgi:hypothetical protein
LRLGPAFRQASGFCTSGFFVQVGEDILDNHRVFNAGDDFHRPTAVATGFDIDDCDHPDVGSDPNPADARAAAVNVGATGYGRPEDLERIGNSLYVAITSEARVLSISLGAKPVVNNFVKAGLNIPVENRTAGITGFKSPDNLANGPDGELWIVEDNVPSDIWVALPDKDGDGVSDGVYLFATLFAYVP